MINNREIILHIHCSIMYKYMSYCNNVYLLATTYIKIENNSNETIIALIREL